MKKIIVLVLGLVLVLSLSACSSGSGGKKLSCTYDQEEQKVDADFNFKDDKLDTVNMNITVPMTDEIVAAMEMFGGAEGVESLVCSVALGDNAKDICSLSVKDDSYTVKLVVNKETYAKLADLVGSDLDSDMFEMSYDQVKEEMSKTDATCK